MARSKSDDLDLNITEGTIIFVAKVLQIERGAEELPVTDAIALMKKALKQLTQ